MRMLPGDARTGAGGMPAYVFDRLLREDRRSELLGLAPEFNAKLSALMLMPSASVWVASRV